MNNPVDENRFLILFERSDPADLKETRTLFYNLGARAENK